MHRAIQTCPGGFLSQRQSRSKVLLRGTVSPATLDVCSSALREVHTSEIVDGDVSSDIQWVCLTTVGTSRWCGSTAK